MSNNKNKKSSKSINQSFDFTLFIVIFLLLALGIVMLLSASSPKAFSETGDSYAYVRKQIKFALAGVVLMIIISKIDYRIYKKFYKLGYIASIGLLLLVLLVGEEANGAKRWINMGFSFQPSEVVKIAMIVFYAAWLMQDKDKLKGFWSGLVLHILPLLPIAALLILEPHFSTTIVIVGICSIMMLMAGVRLWHFIVAGISVGIPGVILLITKAGYRMERIITFLDPWKYETDEGWQVIQSLYAIGSGGLFGVGLGESKQKYLYLPEAHNDFIFSVLAEELGFIGCAIVVILFTVFIWRGILVAIKAPDMFGSLLAVGITALVGIQAILNIAVVTSSIPATGMPLPFFSYGGTALLMLLGTMGILLNISRHNSKV